MQSHLCAFECPPDLIVPAGECGSPWLLISWQPWGQRRPALQSFVLLVLLVSPSVAAAVALSLSPAWATPFARARLAAELIAASSSRRSSVGISPRSNAACTTSGGRPANSVTPADVSRSAMGSPKVAARARIVPAFAFDR